jgi:small redox-active disulfide protein 2
MKIQILGKGCPKCQKLEKNARQAVEELGIDAEVVKVTEMDAIMEMGVMITPGFAINSKVKSTGRVLTKDQIVLLLNETE